MKNSGDLSSNALRDLQNSSYSTKAEFNNCFIIHSKYFPVLKGVSPFRSWSTVQLSAAGRAALLTSF